MAKTSVLKIDVDDSQFKAFFDMFKEYEAHAAEMPKSWKEANSVLNAGMAAVVEQTHNIAKNLYVAIDAQKQFAKATHTGERGLKGMAKSAHSIYESFFKVEKFVLKFGALGVGLFSGGVFGMDKLSNSVMGQAQAARSINESTGKLRAYRTAYKYIAPDNLPESIYQAKGHFRNRPLWQYATGLPETTLATIDSVKASEILIQKAHNYFVAHKGSQKAFVASNPMMHAFAALGMNLQDVTQAGNTPQSQIDAARREADANVKRLNYTNRTITELNDFRQKLAYAGQTLETDFANRVSALGPSLGGLLKALGADGKILIDDVLNPHNLSLIETGLNKFTKYLSSGEAEGAFKHFMASITDLSALIEKIAHPEKAAKDAINADIKKVKAEGVWGILHDAGLISSKGKPASVNDVLGLTPHGIHVAKVIAAGMAQGPLGVHGAISFREYHKATSGVPMTAAQKARTLKLAAMYDKMYHLPPGTLETNTALESGFRMGAVSSKGAMGIEQFMPATAKEYGVTNPNSIRQNLAAAGKYYHALMVEAKRLNPKGSELQNLTMARGEYDFGPSIYARYYKSGKEMPYETRKTESEFASREGAILSQIARNTAKPTKVHITTTTPTAARVAVQANAAAG